MDEVKLCKDCKHVIQGLLPETPRCALFFYEQNLVTGAIENKFCFALRTECDLQNPLSCGKCGRFWEAKHPTKEEIEKWERDCEDYGPELCGDN